MAEVCDFLSKCVFGKKFDENEVFRFKLGKTSNFATGIKVENKNKLNKQYSKIVIKIKNFKKLIEIKNMLEKN